MADAKITALTELTTAEAGDLLLAVDDPAGTPLSKKITVGNFAASHTHSTITREWVGGGGDTSIASTSYATIFSVTDTLAAGDTFIVDVNYVILNDSGGNRTYTYALEVNGVNLELLDGVFVSSSATARQFGEFRAVANIRSSSLTYFGGVNRRMNSQAANTAASGLSTRWRTVWNSSTSDLTGSAKTIAFKVKSDAATATQTLNLLSYKIRKIT